MNSLEMILLLVIVAVLAAFVVWRLRQIKEAEAEKEATKHHYKAAATPASLSLTSDLIEDDAEIAAIGMALHLYLNDNAIHDNESNVITIKRIQRRYSPWSSKIYSMNNLQR